jgi:hypothetical protein
MLNIVPSVIINNSQYVTNGLSSKKYGSTLAVLDLVQTITPIAEPPTNRNKGLMTSHA